MAVVIRLKFDICLTRCGVLDEKRTSAVLRVALGIANVEDFVQGYGGLAYRMGLFDLAKEFLNDVVCPIGGVASSVQSFACLDY